MKLDTRTGQIWMVLLFARGTICVSKNADSRHYVQHKIALSCIIVKIKIAESCYWHMYSKYFP